MQAIETVRDQLEPLLAALIEQLEAEADPNSANHFRNVGLMLAQASCEEDLIMIFIEQLGPTAPLADQAGFSMAARWRLDALLAKAQEVAWAFSAQGDPQ